MTTNIEIIINQIKQFSLEELIEIEKYDLQYKALEKLYNKLQDKEIFVKLVIINALLTYQLSMKWELYWQIFADYFIENKIKNLKKDFKNFLNKYNKRLLQSKYKRLDKILNFINWTYKENINFYIKDETILLKNLSKYMKQKQYAKTIVFCIKMFIWSLKIIWYKKHPSFDIYIPIDNRIWKISKDKNFWLDIAKKTSYPLLLLDTLFYISLWWDLENITNTNLKDKIKNFKIFLKN